MVRTVLALIGIDSLGINSAAGDMIYPVDADQIPA
jgi:hypothetical protein